MIEGYFGLPGSGKTYWAVQEAKKRLDAGEKVFANFEMEGAEYYENFSRFLDLKECFIVLDEAGIWLNARRWKDMPEKVLYRLMESRKYKFDLLYTAQNPEMVETTLRRITNFYWHLRRFGRREWEYRDGRKTHRKAWFHTASLWEPENYRKKLQKPLYRKYFRIDERVAKLYDTEALIIRPE